LKPGRFRVHPEHEAFAAAITGSCCSRSSSKAYAGRWSGVIARLRERLPGS